MQFRDSLHLLIFLAGIGQLLLVAASLAIPRILKWSEDVSKLKPLTQQVFWTYAGYIWVTNLCFGLISALVPVWLLDGSGLAIAVTGFISVYWLARVVIQFTYFDRSDAPDGAFFRIAEFALVSLFLYLTLVYGYAAFVNSV